METQAADTIRVADLEWPWLATVSVDATVQDATDLMAELDIGAVGVLKDGVLEGVVSERDIVRACAARTALEDVDVTALMSRSPHVIGVDADVKDAAMTMAATRVRHLPVTDGKSVVGMISARDLLEVLAGYMEFRRSRLRATLWNHLSFNRPKVRRPA